MSNNNLEKNLEKQPDNFNDEQSKPSFVIEQQMTFSQQQHVPAQIIKEYNEINPNYGERVLTNTEINGQHRRDIENKRLDYIHELNRAELKLRGRGQICALVVIPMFLGASLFSAYNGWEMLSIVLGGATAITGVVNAFLKKGNNNESENN